ncbi:protein regulator of cytokinesis 1-like isoform X1 [Diadema antillarum]|uniref:protein regulator of cytokinesis 1-like isoform X1 n=1 Tax=Diadema antillarum TaxID=105358 RepID=UPI003A8BFFF5
MEAKRRESMKMEIGQCLEQALDKLRDIWNEIGICEEQRVDRQNVVLLHIRNLLGEMVKEEESLQQRLLKSVTTSKEKVTSLSLELGLQPFEPESGLSILQLEKALRLQVDTLSTKKEERMTSLESLKKVEQHLCDILCTTPYYIPTGTVPTEEQLETLKEHIDTLSTEKDQRHKTFTSTKKEILVLMDHLEQGPETSFEREVICEEEESFLLSKENIQALKDLQQELEFKDTENKHIAEDLRDKVTALWNRLSIPQEERDVSASKLEGHKPSTLTTLREEVAKLEDLKKKNLKKVVDAIREELESWWNKCFYSRQQRNQFEAFYDDVITEELLTLHDEALVQVKNYYESNQELLEAVRRREDMWKKMLEFEKKANDPNRFNNRGGNLLEEERIRRKLNKDLPKIEANLGERIAEFEQETGRDFLVDGCRFMDYVAAQWAAHENQKKLIKEERLRARQKQTEDEMLHGSKPNTPVKRRFLGGASSKTPNKRPRGMNRTGVPASPRPGLAHSSIMPSPRMASSKPPKGISTARTPKSLRNTPARLAHRRVLAEKNGNDMSSAFSTSTVLGGHTQSTNMSTLSTASSCGTYTDFAATGHLRPKTEGAGTEHPEILP